MFLLWGYKWGIILFVFLDGGFPLRERDAREVKYWFWCCLINGLGFAGDVLSVRQYSLCVFPRHHQLNHFFYIAHGYVSLGIIRFYVIFWSKARCLCNLLKTFPCTYSLHNWQSRALIQIWTKYSMFITVPVLQNLRKTIWLNELVVHVFFLSVGKRAGKRESSNRWCFSLKSQHLRLYRCNVCIKVCVCVFMCVCMCVHACVHLQSLLRPRRRLCVTK